MTRVMEQMMIPGLEETAQGSPGRGRWEMVKLGDVCYKITDGSHNPPTGTEFPTEFIMLSSKNVFNDALNFEGIRYLEEADFIQENKRTSINTGDVLLTIVGTIGRTLVVRDHHPKFTLQRSVAVLKPNDTLKSEFLMYCLQSKNIQRHFQSTSKGVAQKGIYLNDVKKVQIPLPPLPEQQRIVARLDKAQQLIDKRKEQLALMDSLVQSLFYEMFGDPVKNEKGWEVKTLQQICNKITDGEHSTPIRIENGIKLLSARNVKQSYLDFNVGVDYIGKEEFERIIKRCKPEKGDILISCSGSIGRVCLVRTIEPFALVRSVALLKLSNQVNGIFLEKYLQTNFMQASLQKSAKSSSQANLFLGPINSTNLFLPPLPLQQTFAERVQQIEALKQSMTTSLRELEHNFNSLMQEAFET